MWFVLTMLLGCGGGSSEAPRPAEGEAAAPKEAPHWVKRSDDELAAVFKESCEASVADGKPVLVEFSAPWCLDCRALQLLEKNQAMATEYANFHRVRVDVGRFDRHKALLDHFEVRAIANWLILRPDDCRLEVTRWPKGNQRVVELDSGAAAEEGPQGLIMWLKLARNRG